MVTRWRDWDGKVVEGLGLAKRWKDWDGNEVQGLGVVRRWDGRPGLEQGSYEFSLTSTSARYLP